MKTLIVLLIIILLIEKTISPRLDFTRKGELLLWYGKQNRKFIVIW